MMIDLAMFFFLCILSRAHYTSWIWHSCQLGKFLAIISTTIFLTYSVFSCRDINYVYVWYCPLGLWASTQFSSTFSSVLQIGQFLWVCYLSCHVPSDVKLPVFCYFVLKSSRICIPFFFTASCSLWRFSIHILFIYSLRPYFPSLWTYLPLILWTSF